MRDIDELVQNGSPNILSIRLCLVGESLVGRSGPGHGLNIWGPGRVRWRRAVCDWLINL